MNQRCSLERIIMNATHMPAVLTESGFFTNFREAILLMDDTFLDAYWDYDENKVILFWIDFYDLSHYLVAEFWIGSTSAVFYDWDGNPRQVELPGMPMIVNSRAYLPLRAVADALDIYIEWVPSKQSVVIYFWERPQYVIFPDQSRLAF